MDLLDQIHEVAHNYPGGVEALAARMGKKPDTLRKKLLPRNETHELTVKEMRTIVDYADTDKIAIACANDRGLMCIEKPSFNGLSDKALLDLFLKHEKEKGDWAKEISKSMESGDIDWDEMERIKKEYREFVVAGAEIMSRLQVFMAASEERRQSKRICGK